jgi:CheY-like chemotaxis protein
VRERSRSSANAEASSTGLPESVLALAHRYLHVRSEIFGGFEVMPHILIVDDDSEWSESAAEWLGQCGYSVSRAPNGLAGLHHLSRQPADLVIVDMMMPMMSGAEMLTELRRLPRLRATPVVAVSAMKDAFPPAGDEGPAATLLKPITGPDLRDVVARLLKPT